MGDLSEWVDFFQGFDTGTWAPEELHQFFEAADQNGDGMLDFAEFVMLVYAGGDAVDAIANTMIPAEGESEIANTTDADAASQTDKRRERPHVNRVECQLKTVNLNETFG